MLQSMVLMVKKAISVLIKYMDAHMDQDTMDHINQDNCRLFLVIGCLTSLLFIVTEKALGNGTPYAAILCLIGFLLLSGLSFTNRDALSESPTLVFEGFAALVLVLSAYVEAGARRSDPLFIFPVMVLIIPPLIAERPWKLVLLILGSSFVAVVVCYAADPLFLFRQNLIYLTATAFLSCVLTCHVDQARIRTWQITTISKDIAEHDPLTGILNRAGGFGLIQDLILANQSGTFLIIDVDDFKYINDTYGHQKGDEVLREVASMLAHSFKGSDIVMRMGGDEFIVYAVGMVDARVVRYRLETLTNTIGSIRLSPDPDVHDRVTISIGGAINDGSYPTYDSVYRIADKYLYETKSRGKNGYSLFETGFRKGI